MRPPSGRRRTLLFSGAGLVLLLNGCVNRLTSEQAAPPFVFRSLDLNYRHADGSLAWELKAPEARYDIERRLVQAVRMHG
ncbi:MAG: LPS export ABC transporter periplasmic protein LptC, partial [Cyanobacteriota bacterium]|nr:LPS export ABC transporter periplasmic protein LptC [Cyanobacteriota bacterium]